MFIPGTVLITKYNLDWYIESSDRLPSDMLLSIETEPITRAFNQRTGIVHLRQDFELQTLGPMEMNIACKAMNVVGSRLIASVSAHVKDGTAVSIRCEDSLLLGEVMSPWFEKGTIA